MKIDRDQVLRIIQEELLKELKRRQRIFKTHYKNTTTKR